MYQQQALAFLLFYPAQLKYWRFPSIFAPHQSCVPQLGTPHAQSSFFSLEPASLSYWTRRDVVTGRCARMKEHLNWSEACCGSRRAPPARCAALCAPAQRYYIHNDWACWHGYPQVDALRQSSGIFNTIMLMTGRWRMENMRPSGRWASSRVKADWGRERGERNPSGGWPDRRPGAP